MQVKIMYDNSNEVGSTSPEFWMLVIELRGTPKIVDMVKEHIRELMKTNKAVER